MDVLVQWAGSTPPGQPPNPFDVKLSPLVAAMLAELIRDPEFTARAQRHPLAYGGIVKLGREIDRALYSDATGNAVHYDVSPDARAYLEEIKQGIDQVPGAAEVNSERVSETTIDYTPGRARVSYGGWVVE